MRSDKAKRVDTKLPLAGINNKTSRNNALKKNVREWEGEAERQLKTIPEKQRETVGERVKVRESERGWEAGKKISLTILSPENSKEKQDPQAVCVCVCGCRRVYRGGCRGVRVCVCACHGVCVYSSTYICIFSASA